MTGQEGLKFGKRRLKGEVCSESSLQAYTIVIRNKLKIIQAVRTQWVSGNQPAMRPPFEDLGDWLAQYPDCKMGMKKYPEQDLGQ